MIEQIGRVVESNSAPTTTLSGSLANGARAGMSVTGVAFAGQQLGNVGTAFEGIFGSLVVNPDGSFTYILDNTDPDTNLVATGEEATERFTVTFELGGITQTLGMEIAVEGVDEAVRSFFQTSQPVRLQEDLTLDADTYARFTGNEGYIDERFEIDVPPITLDNFGSIFLDTQNGEPFATSVVLTAQNFTRNFGRIAATTSNPDTIDVSPVIGFGENHGVVTASASVGPDSNGNIGGRAFGWAGLEVNTGLVEAISTYDAYGVWAQEGGPLNNSGLIYVEGGSAYTSAAQTDPLGIIGLRSGGTGALTNSGTIHVVSNTPFVESVGARFFQNSTNIYNPVFIENSGAIVAEIALEVSGNFQASTYLSNTGLIEGRIELVDGVNQIANGAGGTIRGDINHGLDPDLLLNAGAIIGEVDLNASNDFYDAAAGGSIAGQVLGGAGNDRFRGSAASETFFGQDGSDWLEGGSGADQLSGGAGADVFVYTALSDSTSGERDTITDFESGVDTIDIGALGEASFTLTPSGGDTILRAGTLEVLIIGAVVAGDIDNAVTPFLVDGTDGDDLLVGREDDAALRGFAGNDTLHGGSGNDFLDGGPGEDVLYGGGGDDVFIMDDAGDLIVETVDGGRDELQTFVSTILPTYVEVGTLLGSADIAISGNDLDNTLNGNDTDNVLRGNGGNNTIIGGGGADLIYMNIGTHTLVYNTLSDSTRATPDRILFGGERDRIDLSALDVISVTVGEYDTVGQAIGAGFFTLNLTIVSVQTSSGELVIEFDDTPSLDMIAWNRAPGELVQLFGLDEDDTLLGGTSNDRIEARGGADSLFGRDGADLLIGGAGDDAIDGGSNVDTAVFIGNAADYTITQTATGVFEVSGTDGTDTLTTVEFARFDDETIRLRPGTGVSVTFDASSPASYQSAMNAIRDFDGNFLGGDGSWLFIGSVDANGDGDMDQLLVNRAIGRFATVGTDEAGLVYFDDHSWAGETRVAGIYIDPLVQAGIVEQGSPFDSQQRFQNDLLIENINQVLGADDYDGDGLQEVYFALTDGTAYLRALMEADGNIRYANYQSEQEVRDYLTANGYGEETFGTWFGGNSSGEAAQEIVVLAGQGSDAAATNGPAAILPPSMNELNLEFFG